MKLGIVGLPNVGKSTLFNALTKAGAEAANYPFCTIDPNIGVVIVPDVRLAELAEVYNPTKITPATIEFVDIAGLVRGASKGEGLGNQFLSHIREVDAIVHVVRCFDDDNVVHVDGHADPARDVETINIELSLGDLDIVTRRRDKAQKLIKAADKNAVWETEVLTQLMAHLDNGGSANSFEADDKVQRLLDSMPLLSGKPTIYAANLDEEGYQNPEANAHFNALQAIADQENAKLLPVCAKLEAELSTLADGERLEFMNELGIAQSGLDRLIAAGYDLLGYISFLTAGAPEVRAWTITNGTLAPQAAGKIHTDMERGFIRAEVVSYDDFVKIGSIAAARDAGILRSEGKGYVMRDGDIVNFLFNI
ncbi:MAG: redox-regulated ATPase YchF [Oscillospiraceae bacterium]|nr:redox-regulated ATPase YchF [Oscillospiraceae bacterium]